MKIMVVDNHTLFREGVVSLLESQSDMEVVATSDLGEQVIPLAVSSKPDIILLDFGQSYLEGIKLMKRLLSHDPEVSIIILAAQDSDEWFYDVIYNGAKGYLYKNITKSMLLVSLRALARGEAVISRSGVTRILSEFVRLGKMSINNQGTNQEKGIHLLTYREMEILKLLITRATNREIANQLSISENTVRVHVSSILDKLKLRNRREASAFAERITLPATKAMSEQSG
jgi:two-component system NarL family response regulator